MAEATVPAPVPTSVTRTYVPEFPLKYGCNPHQTDANIYSVQGAELPFNVLNGKPGYINLLDALNAWQLVRELRHALNLPAAASFKHASPAGAAVAVELTPLEAEAYELGDRKLTPQALAYFRARNADPMCSFGDFAAMSDVVDEETAQLLKTEVSDGIIAAGFTEKALEILKAKKGGAFIVLQGKVDFKPELVEYREVFGCVFAQRRNDALITPESMKNVVTANASLSEGAVRDLIVATIAIKYTQSNSVAFAVNGQCIGVGAGQQSRVDCVKLAGRKVQIWYLRQHEAVRALKFKKGSKRQDRINARVRYIEGDFGAKEREAWEQNFETVPEPLSPESKDSFMTTLSGVSLSSDAFFPFRDSIDAASRQGVQFVAQPGGSVQDTGVIEACNDYGMAMAFTGVRVFHH